MAAAVHLATSAEILPRNAPIIPPGSYQQRVSSGLLCERKTLLKNPSHLTGIEIHFAEEVGREFYPGDESDGSGRNDHQRVRF
jgi:hypothetical protein